MLTFPPIRRVLKFAIAILFSMGVVQQASAGSIDAQASVGLVTQAFFRARASDPQPTSETISPSDEPPDEPPAEPPDEPPDESPDEPVPLPLFDWCPLPPPLPTSG